MLACLVWSPLAGAEPRIIAVYQGSLASEPGRDAPGGDTMYHVDVRGLDGVADGAILVAFRRVPSSRGDAEFRDDPVWLESGRLQVESLAQGFATARLLSGPARPLPALDADGLHTDRACIGDRVIDSGERGLSGQSVSGHFSVELLFTAGSAELVDGADEVLRLWLHRYAVRGSVRVDVALLGTAHAARTPSVKERVGRKGAGPARAAVEREEDELALGQRRAAAVAAELEQILGWSEGDVMATVSWASDEATEADVVHIHLTEADVLPAGAVEAPLAGVEQESPATAQADAAGEPG